MRNIQQILCPIDLSDASHHALDHARALAQWYKAKITVLHVCNPIVMPPVEFVAVGAMAPPVLTDDERVNARQQVLEFIGGERDDTSVVIESGQAAPGILKVASDRPADLIVIGTHGIGGFEHLLLGSVTEKVLRTTTCPVLTVPPRARDDLKIAVQTRPVPGGLLRLVAGGARTRVVSRAGGRCGADDPPRVRTIGRRGAAREPADCGA